jgi:O-methyltransferase involved in polyketide biosynthesis
MTEVPVSLTEEKETLLATLYGRALDATSKHPILGDRLAVDIMDKIDYDFSHTKINFAIAASVAARAKFLDSWTRDFLAAHERATVLHLAAGLDSRAWRIDPGPGVHWYDVDFPDVIELRRKLYPERDHYTMIGASVLEPGWLDPIPVEPPVFVLAEGLTMYLAPQDGHLLFRRVTDHFEHGEIAFDCQNSVAIKLQKLNPAVRTAGATLSWGIDDPHELELGNDRLHLVDLHDSLYAPGSEDLPLPTRLTAALVRPFPPLRKLGMYLRYAF